MRDRSVKTVLSLDIPRNSLFNQLSGSSPGSAGPFGGGERGKGAYVQGVAISGGDKAGPRRILTGGDPGDDERYAQGVFRMVG